MAIFDDFAALAEESITARTPSQTDTSPTPNERDFDLSSKFAEISAQMQLINAQLTNVVPTQQATVATGAVVVEPIEEE